MTPIDEIKQKIDVVDLVGEYVDLKKAGRNYRGLCPFHSEKTPSFMVSPELQIFKCFGCGEGGDVFSFYQKIEGLEFPQALENLAEKTGVKLPKKSYDPDKSQKKKIYTLNDLSGRFYNYLLTKPKVGKQALKYLKDKRKLSDETIKDFNLGYAPDSWDSLSNFLKGKKHTAEDVLAAGLIVQGRSGGFIDKFRKRITFPLTDIGGNVVGFTARVLDDGEPKYLNTPETLVFHKSSYLFGLDKAKVALKKEGAIFVEGQMDVISAYQAGIENVIATSGTSLTVGQLKLLSRYTTDITFAFDSDTAGLNALHRAIELAEKQGFNIKIAMIPEEYKDLDEFIQSAPKKVKSFLEEGIPAFDFFLVSALRRHNVQSPIGKKKAMAELVPIFSQISDPVLRDHYIKQISDKLDITETVVASLLTGTASEEAREYVSIREKSEKDNKGVEQKLGLSKKSPEEYILALLLKAPIESSQTVLYKLGQKDFVDAKLQEIFTQLKAYLTGRKRKFDIQSFTKKFDEELNGLVNELYLWDLGELNENEVHFNRELEGIYNSVKKRTARRELKGLGEQIKQAELAKDKVLLKDLSEQFGELSGKLI